MTSASSKLFDDYLSKSRFRPESYDSSSELGRLGENLNINLSSPPVSGPGLGGPNSFIDSPEMQILRDEQDPLIKMELLRRMGEET
jgi:hypothetical protein